MPTRVVRHAVTQPLNESYRFIPLTQGRNAIVDEKDFKWLSQWNWRVHWNGWSFYAARSESRRNIYMHRQILGCKGKEEGDHWNHDTLDNRRANLRKATSSQNKHNGRLRRGNKFGFKGVSYFSAGSKGLKKRFVAQITFNRKLIRLGYFLTAEEAAKAYDDAAKKYHREFALLNFS